MLRHNTAIQPDTCHITEVMAIGRRFISNLDYQIFHYLCKSINIVLRVLEYIGAKYASHLKQELHEGSYLRYSCVI